MLHDVFDVPFGDIAEVVGRRPEAVRQLASRARRHVKRQSPRFAASSDEHDCAVRAFGQAVAEGNLEGLAWVALSRRSTREPIEIKLNGRLGLVLPSGDGQRAALSFVVNDRRITRIDAIRNPEKLRRL